MESSIFLYRSMEAHLYLNGPREVANIDEERDVGAVAEVEVLVGEAVLELLDVAPGDDGDLLPGLGAGWRAERRTEREREGGRMEGKKWKEVYGRRWNRMVYL